MVTFKDSPVHLSGAQLQEKQQAPDFELRASDLTSVSLSVFEGSLKILNVFPSLDTGVCKQSVLIFEEKLEALLGQDVILIHISKDLPFAQSRFCSAHSLNKAVTLSAFDSSFGVDYGLLIEEGPLRGLLARAVFILDKNNQIIYKELVHEITQEPNYGKALENLENFLKPKGS